MEQHPSNFRIDLSPPQNGWIAIEVQAGEQHFSESVSYTPNDFIAELVSALCLLSKGSPEAAALAFSEPTTYHFRFWRQANANLVQFEIQDAKTPAKPLLTMCMASEELCQSFWRAFRRLASVTTPDQYQTAMRRPFPSSGVETLGLLSRRLAQT